MLVSTVISATTESVGSWTDVCRINDILPFTGVAALISGEQVAVFRLASATKSYAISNYDPFSAAFVISRGLVGDKGGTLKVASPIYKNTFNLLTGQCLEDATIWLKTWPVRVIDGTVQIAV